MRLPIQKIMRRSIMTLLASVAVGFSTPDLSLFEGRIGQDSKVNGYYDLRLQIWDRSGQEVPRLFQTIEIPHVLVKDGRFVVSVDAGLESKMEADLEVKIQARAFESWTSFKPAEISLCKFQTGKPEILSTMQPPSIPPLP